MSFRETLRKVFGRHSSQRLITPPKKASPSSLPTTAATLGITTPSRPELSGEGKAEFSPVPTFTRAEIEKAKQDKNIGFLAAAHRQGLWHETGLAAHNATYQLAYQAVAEQDTKTLGLLGELLPDETCKVLHKVQGPEAVPVLVALVAHKELQISRAAMEKLAEMRATAATEALIALLATGDHTYRASAYKALGQIGDPRAADALTSAISKEVDSNALREAAGALQRVAPGGQAFEAIVVRYRRAVGDRRRSEVLMLANALLEIGDRRAVPDLKEQLNHGFFGDKQSSLSVKVRDKAVRFVYGRQEVWAEELWTTRNWAALRTAGKETMEDVAHRSAEAGDAEALLAWIDQPAALQALATIRNPRAVPVLVSAAAHSEERVRQAVMEALGKIGGLEAVEALGKSGGQLVVGPLIKQLCESRDEMVRQAAALALGKIGDPKAVDQLIRLLGGDVEVKVRQAAAEALGKICDPKAMGPLVKLLGEETDEKVRQTVQEARRKIKTRQAEREFDTAVQPVTKSIGNIRGVCERGTVALQSGSLGIGSKGVVFIIVAQLLPLMGGDQIRDLDQRMDLGGSLTGRFEKINGIIGELRKENPGTFVEGVFGRILALLGDLDKELGELDRVLAELRKQFVAGAP